MRIVRPHIDDDYVTDLKLLSLDSWTKHRQSDLKGPGSGMFGGVQVRDETRKAGYGVGLNNLGNTCYLNSLLQALFRATLFRENILLGSGKGPTHRELAKVFAGLSVSQKKSFSPTAFLKVIPGHFKLGEQQDVNEFAKYLLDAVERECKHEEICGKSVTVVVCKACSTSSEMVEPFSDLSLLFPADHPKEKELTLDVMMEHTMFKKELMSGENQFKCNVCEKKVDAELHSEILETPTYLMVTLQRFQYVGGVSKKIMRSVKFGRRMNLPLRGCVKVQYVLFAVIFHSGSSSGHGHYYCHATDSTEAVSDDSCWELYNDSIVQKSSFSQLAQIKEFPLDTPYVLFYKKMDEDCQKREELSIPEDLKQDIF